VYLSKSTRHIYTHTSSLIPQVASVHLTRQSYAIVVSVPVEKHKTHIYTYIITYLPSGIRAFNVAWTALYTLWEHIHVLRKRPQDIPRSTHTRCAVVTSCTTDTKPLLHDRDYPQASLVLRGRVQDSHHPTGRYLPAYLGIGASLQKVNCVK
jgi:hypothetical protein